MGIDWKLAAIPMVAFAALSCGRISPEQHAEPSGKAFSYAQRIGWFHGSCLAISNPQLTGGTPVGLVITGEPQEIGQARILAQTDSPTVCKALMPGRIKGNAKPGITFYALDAGSLAPAAIGIGIVSPPGDLVVADGLARADLDHDGRTEIFSSCATSEGMKFSVWTGKPYSGESRWSAYYYLDYDMTPTCP